MNNELVIKLPKGMKKAKKGLKLLVAVAMAGITVYTLIPKDEKIKGINTDSLVKK